MLLSNLIVKSPFTKIKEDNIFEDMMYQFYILLLFDSVEYLEKKN